MGITSDRVNYPYGRTRKFKPAIQALEAHLLVHFFFGHVSPFRYPAALLGGASFGRSLAPDLLPRCPVGCGDEGKSRRADGEGTLEWLPKAKRWRIRLSVRTPEGTKRKSFTAKRQGDVIKKRDEYLKNTGMRNAVVRRSIDPDKTVLSDYLQD